MLYNRKVLLIDLDSQGSASFSLGISRDRLSPGSASVMLEGLPVSQAIRPTGIAQLGLITGSISLANVDIRLSDVDGRESLLRNVIQPVQDKHHFILIDCPPSLGLLTVNALVASDYYLAPVNPHYLALEGLVNLIQAVDLIQEGIGHRANFLGIVLTMVDRRTRAANEISELIRQHYNYQVFATEVPVNTKLAEAPSWGQTIFEYAPTSTGARAYQNLAHELLKRVDPNSPIAVLP